MIMIIWWYMPTFIVNFVEKRCVFGGFGFNSFCSKVIIGICKFYEFYSDIRVKVERWSSIMWDALDIEHVWFKASITMASLRSI